MTSILRSALRKLDRAASRLDPGWLADPYGNALAGRNPGKASLVSNLPEGATPIDHPTWNRRLQDWGYLVGEIFHPMSDLIGTVVNIGTKDGVVYDTALVVAFRDAGMLVLDGGRKRFPLSPERGVASMEGPEDVHCNDIARGYVHPGGTR
jgi:hypothetical protein